MAKDKSFSYFIDPEEKIVLRSSFTIASGKIEKFAVQLEIEGKVAIRFDNAHGFMHQHTFNLKGKSVTRKLKFTDQNQAYNYCYQFIKANWRSLADSFRRSK